MNRRIDERDLEQTVRSWMRGDDEHPADRNRQVGRIMGRVDETHQRRGAWRLLPFGVGHPRTDQADDELYADGLGGVGIRLAVAPAAMVVVTVALVVFLGAAFLAWTPRSVQGPGAAPAPTTHPEDIKLLAALADIWSGEPPSLDEVKEVYAADAMHTALWHDSVDRLVGPFAIWSRILVSEPVEGGPWTPIRDAETGEHRYLGVTQKLGGIACVLWIADERITRHDCILPIATDEAIPEDWEVSESTLETWEALKQDVTDSWATVDREAIQRAFSTDIEHHVALDNHQYTLKGVELYDDNMGAMEIHEVAPALALPAPAGEARWTDYGSLAGGTLCVFQARDGLITRHDCIVPSMQSNQPLPAAPSPTATGT